MKNVLIASILCVAAIFTVKPASAQTSAFGSGLLIPLAAGDTLVNVDSVMKFITTTAGYQVVGIHALVNKISGTPAGKLILMGGDDGVNYLESDSMTLVTPPVNSATTPTAFLEGQITKTSAPFSHYLIMVTNTASTSSAQVRIWYTLRKTIVTPSLN